MSKSKQRKKPHSGRSAPKSDDALERALRKARSTRTGGGFDLDEVAALCGTLDPADVTPHPADSILAELVDKIWEKALLPLEAWCTDLRHLTDDTVFPGYTYSHTRLDAGDFSSFGPLSAFGHDFEDGGVQALSREFAKAPPVGLPRPEVAIWMIGLTSRLPIAPILAMHRDGAVAAYIHMPPGMKPARLKSPKCLAFVLKRLIESSDFVEKSVVDLLLPFITGTAGTYIDPAEGAGMLTHLLPQVQGNYFCALMAMGGRVLDKRQELIELELALKADHEQDLTALRKRLESKVDHLENLYRKATTRANDAEAALRSRKMQESKQNSAPARAAGRPLADRVASLF